LFTEDAVALQMSDGVRLDASVLVPDGPAPSGGFPALVLVHGHGDDGNKSMPLARWGRRHAGRGYAVVAYSVRGQGASEGLSFHLGARELFDLLEVLTWTRRSLPVNPAKVGLVGSSQGGWHAWMAAAFDPDLAVAIPQNIFVDYADFAVSDGCLSRWFFTRTMRRRVLSAGLQDLARSWAIAGEWDRLRTWLSPFSPRVHAARIRCPILAIHGWHDQGMPADPVIDLVRALPGPRRLIVGGGGHDGVDVEDAARLRTDEEDRWIDGWLRGDGVVAAPFRYTAWPGWGHVEADRVPSGAEQTLWLRAGGALMGDPPDAPCTHAHLAHQPRVRGYGLADALDDDLAGAADAWGGDPITWTGAPLERPISVLGGPTTRLFLQSDRPAHQVAVTLLDVAPDGSAQRVTWGHHGTRAAVAGQVRPVDVRLRAVAWTFAAGHRLRLVVSANDPSSVFPWFERYVLRVHQDPGLASRVTLPLAGAGAAS
jgi:predicted acyl esterase